MPGQDQLYKQYADIPSLDEQTAKILAMFDEVEAGMKRLSDFGIKINTGSSARQVQGLGNEFDALGDSVKKQQAEIIKMAVKLAALTTEEAKQQEALKQVTALTKGLTAEQIKAQKIRQGEYEQLQAAKQANKELAASIQLRLRIRNAEEGSIEQLGLKYQKLQGILSKLSKEQREGTRGTALSATAKALSDQVNTLKKGQGDFSKNVGRYAESLGSLFEGVRKEITKLKAEEASLQQQQANDPSGFASRGGEQQIQRVSAALSQLGAVESLATKEGVSFVQVQRQIERAFQNMSASGAQSSEFLEEFKKDAAKAKDEAQDLKDEIKALSSDTRKLDLAVGTISVLASGMEALSGAAALAGGSTEDVARITQKLVAIQSVANGVREVGEQITKRGTAANKAYNFVLKQTQILFGSGTTAAQKFGAGLKLIGIGLLITGISYLITKLDLFGESSKDAAEEADKLNDSIEALYNTTKRLTDLSVQNPGDNLQITALKKELSLQQASGASAAAQFETKKKIAEAERNLAGKQIDDILKRGDALDDVTDQELDSYEQIVKAQQGFYDETVKANGELQALRRQRIAKDKELTDDEKENYDTAIKNQEAYVNLTSAKYEEYTAVINNAVDKQQQLEDVIAEDRKRRFEAEKKAALDLLKFRKDIIIEQKNFESSDDNIASVSTKVAAAKASAEAQKAVTKAQFDFDISQKDLANSAKIQLEEAYAKDIYDIDYKLANKIVHLYVFEKNERLRLAQEGSDDFDAEMEARVKDKADRQQKAFEREQAQLATFRDESEKNNADNFEAGLKTYDDYAKKKEEIENTYQRLVLESQLRFYKIQRDMLKESGEDTTEIDAAIANAEAQLANNRIDIAKKVRDENKVIADQIRDNYLAAFEQIGQAFINVFSAIAESRKQQLQDEIDMIDERKEKEIAAASAGSDSEEKKAARIKIIEAKAQSEKDQRARKQRQIDRQNAILERAFKAFQITTDTIMAVNKIQLQIAAAPPPLKPLYASQLILAIAGGAASLTQLLAAPLPKYARGGVAPFDQFAEVAEEGPEMSVSPSGKLKLYDKRQVTRLIKGEKILPANITRGILQSASMDLALNAALFSSGDGGRQVDDSLQRDMLHELKQFNKRKPLNINISETMEATPYYQNQIKH